MRLERRGKSGPVFDLEKDRKIPLKKFIKTTKKALSDADRAFQSGRSGET